MNEDASSAAMTPAPVAGYTGVVNSETLAGYTSAEGYTGVIVVPSTSGYTGSAPVDIPAGGSQSSGTPPVALPPSAGVPMEPSGAAASTGLPQVTPSAEPPIARKEGADPGTLVGPPTAFEYYIYNVLTERVPLWDVMGPPSPQLPPPSPPAPQEEEEEEEEEDWLLLPDALEAVLEDPKVGRLTAIMQPSPNLSKESNDAIRQIQDRLEALAALKPSIVGSGYVLGVTNKVRGTIPLVSPQVSPSSKLAKELGPEAAHQMDNIVRARVSDMIDGQLIRSNLTAEERTFWESAHELAK